MVTSELAMALAIISIIVFPALLMATAWKARRDAEKLYEAEKCRVTETISMAEWRRRYMDK